MLCITSLLLSPSNSKYFHSSGPTDWLNQTRVTGFALIEPASQPKQLSGFGKKWKVVVRGWNKKRWGEGVVLGIGMAWHDMIWHGTSEKSKPCVSTYWFRYLWIWSTSISRQDFLNDLYNCRRVESSTYKMGRKRDTTFHSPHYHSASSAT